MRDVGCIHRITQAVIPNHDRNVKHKSMEAVLDKRPSEQPDREKPKQVSIRSLRFGAERDVEEKHSKQGEHPEGAKSYKPLFQVHTFILIQETRLRVKPCLDSSRPTV